MEKRVFKSSAEWKKGLQVEVKSRDFSVILDEPEQLGGSNVGMTPVEMLLGSLAGCISITISAFAPKFHVDIEELSVDVEGDFDPAGFMGLNKDARIGLSSIRYTINLKSKASEDRVQKLIELAKARCPVSDTLQGVPIESNYVLNEEKIVL